MRGMWRRAVSLGPRFAQLGLEPPVASWGAVVRTAATAAGRSAGRRATAVPGSRRTAPRRRQRSRRRRPQLAPRAVAGSLSSRQRSSFVPWRKRLPCTLSYRTSTTSSGRTRACSSSPLPQRFGSEMRPLGCVLERAAAAAPRPRRGSARRRRTSRRSRARRPRRTGRAAASRSARASPFQRIPTTTQSAVLCSFTLTTPSREPGRYGAPSRFATTPSSPSASKRSSQRARLGEVGRARREPEARRHALELAPAAPRTAASTPARLPRRARRRRRTPPGSRPTAAGSATRPDGAASASRRSRARRRARSRSRRRAPTAAAGARRAVAAPGSSAAAAARCATTARARRRGSRARRGSRPTSARTASRSPSGSSRTSSASIGGNGSSASRSAQSRRKPTVSCGAMKRVAVTGIGVVSPLGLTRPRRGEQRSPARAASTGSASSTPTACRSGSPPRSKGFDPPAVASAKDARKLERNVLFALSAAQEALADAALTDSTRRASGSSSAPRSAASRRSSSRRLLRERGPDRVSPSFLPSVLVDTASGQIAIALGIKGSTTRRLGLRDRLARDRRGGRDDQARRRRRDHRGRHRGVHRPADPRRLHRDARARRRGRVPAARLAPVRRDARRLRDRRGRRRGRCSRTGSTPSARGAEIYAEVLGYGASNDAHHLAQPEPEAIGVAAMMRSALERAGVEPERVGYINAHGTVDPARRPRRDEGDQGRLRRARLRARGLLDEVDDGPHLRRGRRDRGDHVHPRAPRRRPAADDQLPRARPRLRPRLRPERGPRRRRSTSRSRTRWASAATTAASCSAAPIATEVSPRATARRRPHRGPRPTSFAAGRRGEAT